MHIFRWLELDTLNSNIHTFYMAPTKQYTHFETLIIVFLNRGVTH